MATKTEDETGTTIDTEKGEDVTKAEHPGDGEQNGATGDIEAGQASDVEEQELPGGSAGSGQGGAVGQGAGAVVSAALGVVSLTGGWLGTVAGQRSQLIGQLRTSTSADVAKQIEAVYGNAWNATALWAGCFALLALVVGVVVLARPAFGSPERAQAPWIKSVAWAGVAIGVLGLLLAVLKYTGALLGLPSVS